MAYICSKNPSHQSEDSDYCSICGAKIVGAAGLAASPASPAAITAPSAGMAAPSGAGGGAVCPDCGTPRTSGARFCEVCRYDFERQAPSPTAPPPPMAAQPVAPPPMVPQPIAAVTSPAPAAVASPPISASAPVTPAVESVADPAATVIAPAPAASIPMPDAVTAPPTSNADAPASVAPATAPDTAGMLKWEALLVVDPSLYTDPDPDIPLPANEPERTFPLDFAENLIGRRSDRKDIHPEIVVNDPGISHRHAKLLRQPDGSFILLDVGSTNGTRLNDVEVKPGVRTPLRDGDQITLGCWTRITIRVA
jgi:hypothetical protein